MNDEQRLRSGDALMDAVPAVDVQPGDGACAPASTCAQGTAVLPSA